MKYVVTVNGKQYEVEVEKIGGTSKSLGRQPIERGMRRENLTVEKVAPTVSVPVQEVKTETLKSSGLGVEILSPMPGVILGIKVKVGDKVSFGETLAVLEAMKMENDIPATQDGEVAEIRVKEGDTVDTDAVLIVLK